MLRIDQMSLRMKIGLGPALLVLVLIGAVIALFTLLNSTMSVMTKNEQEVTAPLVMLDEFDRDLNAITGSLYQLTSIATNESDQAKVARIAKDTNARLGALSESSRRLADILSTTPLDAKMVADLKEPIGKYFSRAARVTEMADSDGATALTLMVPTSRHHAEVADTLGRIRGQLHTMKSQRQETLAEWMFNARAGFGVAMVVIILFAVVLVLRVVRRVSQPMMALSRTLETMTGGDYTASVPGLALADEVGMIARAVEFLRVGALKAEEQAKAQQREQEARLRRGEAVSRAAADFDSRVAVMIQTLTSASAELETVADQMKDTSAQAGLQAAAVSSESSEMVESTEIAASAAEEMAASIGEIARQVEHSARISRDAVDQSTQNEAKVAGLEASVGKIGDIARIIAAIASQTNLLALNATIEAARAGEAGKGFAVVANEVKSLAHATANATEEISSQISQIQEQTRTVGDAIRQFTGVIQQVGQISDGIAASVQQQSAATQEIVAGVARAAQGTASVSKHIAALEASAVQTGTIANMVLAASSESSKQSNDLKTTIARFLTEVRT